MIKFAEDLVIGKEVNRIRLSKSDSFLQRPQKNRVLRLQVRRAVNYLKSYSWEEKLVNTVTQMGVGI